MTPIVLLMIFAFIIIFLIVYLNRHDIDLADKDDVTSLEIIEKSVIPDIISLYCEKIDDPEYVVDKVMEYLTQDEINLIRRYNNDIKKYIYRLCRKNGYIW